MHTSRLCSFVLLVTLLSPISAFADNHPPAEGPPAQSHVQARSKKTHGPQDKTMKNKAHGQPKPSAAPKAK
jgi:hypothetical protein